MFMIFNMDSSLQVIKIRFILVKLMAMFRNAGAKLSGCLSFLQK